jgi:hypothetical protein
VPTEKAFGGGVGQSIVGSGVLVLMLLAIVLVFLLPRRFVLAPLMFGVFLLPFGQTFVLGGVHIFVFRLMLLAGLIRASVSRSSDGPLFAGGFNAVDKLFVGGTIYGAVAFVLRFRDVGAVVNQFGILWDVLGGYFAMRFLIRDDDDVQRAVKILTSVAAILAITMLYEKIYDVNLYARIAGQPIIPEIRNGSIRAQGPFHHAILAGCFGATLLPLFFWLWKSGKSMLVGIVGMLASTAITFSSASSTPVSAYLAGVLGIAFWLLRNKMRAIRWGIVVGILLLNFAMHAPVWYFLEHIDLAGGSAGEHRAELIDNFVRHFGDWWLIGTSDNAKWGFEMWDISNQYIAQGEGGGLVALVCFVAVITLSFKKLGASRKSNERDRAIEWYFWLLGVALFSNIVAFLGISYFDQTQVSWYALLAMISVATSPLLIAKPVPNSVRTKLPHSLAKQPKSIVARPPNETARWPNDHGESIARPGYKMTATAQGNDSRKQILVSLLHRARGHRPLSRPEGFLLVTKVSS